MTEQTTEQQPAEKPQEGGEQQQQPKETEQQQAKTFDADYVDKLRKEAAKYRNEAKTNADAAKRLAEIEDAQKSESEKAAERIRTLEAEVQNTRREALRFKIAAQFSIDDEDAELFLTGSDEETLTKQAERLQKRNEDAGKPRSPRPDPTQGKQQATPLDPRSADLAQIEADLAAARRR
jgi:hypothetical protein